MISKRMERFEAMKTHPMLGRDFTRLKPFQIQEVHDFIVNHAHLDDGQFIMEANRWKMGTEKNMKAHSIQWSILVQCVDTVGNLRARRGPKL